MYRAKNRKSNENFFLNVIFAVLLGFVYGLCFFGKIPIYLNIVSLSGLLFLIRWTRYPFIIGYLYGFTFFIVSMNWISTALLVGPPSFIYLEPIVKLLLPSILAIFIGMFAYVVSQFRDEYRFIVAAPLWYIFESIRSLFPLAFPWNMLSSLYSHQTVLVQITSVIGASGLNLLAGYFSFIIYNKDKKVFAFFFIVLMFLIGFGYNRLGGIKEYRNEVKIRVVQSNNPIALSESIHKRFRKFDTLLRKSLPSDDTDITHIIFPEAIFPFSLQYPYVDILSEAMKLYDVKNGLNIIMGCERVSRSDNVYNSVLFTNEKNTYFYDKKVLVPFGEYVPYKWAKKIMKGTATMISFKRGKSNKLVPLGGINILPLVCFESIFSGRLYEFDIESADLIVNVNNSAWFKGEAAAQQHLSISMLRAIEYGLPINISSNSGISASVDPYGNILNMVGDRKEGYIDSLLPKKVSTLYSKHKDMLDIFYIVFSVGIVVLFILLSFGRNVISSRVGNYRHKV